MNDSALSFVVSFAIVVAIIPMALWLLKRSPMGSGSAMGKNKMMRTISTLPLSSTHRVVTVEVGTGIDRKWLVLGVTPQHINTLHTLPPQEAAPNDVNL
jgi:flagellar protein FliO/FliZ